MTAFDLINDNGAFQMLTDSQTGEVSPTPEVEAFLAGGFDVTAYGATGDGVTDDVAAIQAAIDAAEAAGGGEVYFPAGNYKLIDTTTVTYADAGTSDYHLSVMDDHITFRGVGRSSILTAAAGANTFHLYKTPTSESLWEFAHAAETVYTMTAAAAGDRTVTLATPAEAANFAAGDYILVRTGQLVAALTRQPDAELNQVVSVNAGTGVVALRWPLAKGYAQEYFITGTTGKTSTSVTPNPALFGVANVTAHTMADIAFRDLHFEGPTSVYAIIGSGIAGFEMSACTGLFGSGPLSVNIVRHGKILGNRFDFAGTGAGTYSIGIGNGSSDLLVADNILTGEHTPFVHVHEGWASASIIGNVISSPATATSSAEVAISIRARAYDISVLGNVITGRMGVGIYVDEDCMGGGIIAHNVVPNAPVVVETAAPNWMVRDNLGPGYVYAVVPTQTAQSRDILSAWLIHGQTEVALGTIPANSAVLAVRVVQWTPFNGSGTDLVSLGIAADHTKWMDPVDVSVGYNVTTPTTKSVGWEYANADAVAYYTHGGTAASAGTCCVIIEYVRIPNGAN